jgi:A/G-specific adenine glycosylase
MSSFSESLIAWFQVNARELPWRQTRDPYRIWISEVILQQTRVAQGTAYYHRFLERFPNLSDLALAAEEDVLSLWQGLGYYSRARNLHAAAKFVQTEKNGDFPPSFKELLSMKGVGTYTAAAIAAFAYGENVPVVDGNVMRVFCRYFGIHDDVRLPATMELVRSYAAQLLPAGKSWEFNQAIMELGALVCTPSSPLCATCPVAMDCFSRKNALQAKLPFKSKAKSKRIRHFNYLLLEHDGFFAFKRRGEGDIWEGLFEPILLESEKPFSSPGDFDFLNPADPKSRIETFLLPSEKHILTHQELHIHVCVSRLSKPLEEEGLRWVSGTQLSDLPKPIIFSKIISKARSSPLYLVFHQ